VCLLACRHACAARALVAQVTQTQPAWSISGEALFSFLQARKQLLQQRQLETRSLVCGAIRMATLFRLPLVASSVDPRHLSRGSLCAFSVLHYDMSMSHLSLLRTYYSPTGRVLVHLTQDGLRCRCSGKLLTVRCAFPCPSPHRSAP
jgi:hypothetical protein